MSSAPGDDATRVMLYDASCALCTATSAALVRLGLVPAGARRALQALDERERERMLAAGAANEIVVRDERTGELRAGADGILWLLSASRLAPLARLARRPVVLAPLTALYRFVAVNRRFLTTPPPGAPTCDCEPAPRTSMHVALLAVCALVATLVPLALGAVAPADLGLVGARLGLLGPLVKAGWPWALPVLLGLTLDAAHRLPYLVHLAATAAAGALVLLPLAVAGAIAPGAVALAFESLLQLGCAAAGILMFAMQRRRVAFLRLPAPWLFGWAACAGFGLLTLGWLHTLG